jgi:thermitase
VGVATVETMSACIQYAIDHHIRIVNMSYFALSAPEVLEKARLLHQAGGMLFLPSGNSGEEMTYPKSNDYVVVSSTEPSDWLSMFSNRGPAVDMAAPGNAILTTEIGGTYTVVRGTSNSAPLVAGAAALLLGMNPQASIDEIINVLHSTAKDLGTPGLDNAFGYGRLNVGLAVETYSKQLSKQ